MKEYTQYDFKTRKKKLWRREKEEQERDWEIVREMKT